MRNAPAWDEVARLYLELARGRSPAAVRALRTDALRLVADAAGRRVLDVGCGTGAFARRLAEDGAQVFGIDDDAEAIEEAKADARVVDSELPPVFAVADPGDVSSWPDGNFDLITWLDLERAPEELRNVVRKIRRGGRLVLATPHPYGTDKPIDQPFESLMGWLREAGVRVIDVAEPTKELDYLVILAERPARRKRRR